MAFRGIGSNITDEAIKRLGKSIGHTAEILHNFDSINNIKEPSGRHSKLSTDLDMKLIRRQLHEESSVFSEISGRAHRSFPKFEANPISFFSFTSADSLYVKSHLDC